MPPVSLPTMDRPPATRPPTPHARGGSDPTGRTWYRIDNSADGDEAEVWIYDEIGGWGVWASDVVDDLRRIEADRITLHLNSPGGDVFDGVAIANSLIEHPATVTVKVDALAASIASVIALAGDRVIMGRAAQMMIHNASALCWGQAADLRQMADLLDKITGVIAQVYADRTGTPVKGWREAMDAETWYTAEEAVEAGLADEVAAVPERDATKARAAAARWDLAGIQDTGRVAAVLSALPAPAPTLNPAGDAWGDGFDAAWDPALLAGAVSTTAAFDAVWDPKAAASAITASAADAPAIPDPEPEPAPAPAAPEPEPEPEGGSLGDVIRQAIAAMTETAPAVPEPAPADPAPATVPATEPEPAPDAPAPVTTLAELFHHAVLLAADDAPVPTLPKPRPTQAVDPELEQYRIDQDQFISALEKAW
jgi:ATP-dependent protease ClpP protease subunit